MLKPLLTPLLTTLFLAGSSPLHAGGFKEDLGSALQTHRNATTPEEQRQALTQVRAVAEAHPEQWLAHYWAAYLTTQAARLGEQAQMRAEMDRAQSALDRARELQSEPSAREQADFMALQHLIHNFRAGTYWREGDQENGMKYTDLAKATLGDAILAEPDNPRVYVLTGTGLISDGNRQQDRTLVLAGKVLLERAEQLFDAEKDLDPLKPDWAREWIGHWLTRQTSLLTAASPR